MKTPDIILCLRELGIAITEEELANPDKNRDQVRRMFEHLTEICTGVTRDEMNQPAFAGLPALIYPTLHEDSIPQINFLRACQKMMETCGIVDFSIRDFIEPSAKRLRRQLSGIINFAKFREERMVLFNDIQSQRGELLATLNASRRKRDSLKEQLKTLKEQTAEEAISIARIEGECREVESEIAGLNHKQAEIREESSELKTENFQLKDSLSSKSLHLEELLASKKKLQGQIVNSPDRFRKQIADVETALRAEQTEIRGAEKKYSGLSNWLTNVEDAQVEVDHATEVLNEVKSEVEKQKAMFVDTEALKSKLASTKEMTSQQEQNIQSLSRQATRADEKLTQLRKQAMIRSTDCKETIESLHSQLLEADKSRIEANGRAKRAEQEADRVEREANAEQDAQSQALEDLTNQYKKMESVVVKHLQALQSAISDTPSDNHENIAPSITTEGSPAPWPCV
jgi:chromosome segregation ATPase